MALTLCACGTANQEQTEEPAQTDADAAAAETTEDAQAENSDAADSVFRNANIYTADDDNPTATAIAVKDGRLVYVGDEAGVEAFIGDSTEVEDLNGLTMLPGMMEGHNHFEAVGSNMDSLDLFWKPKDVILDRVAAAVEAAEDGEWITGSGWLNTMWDDTAFPTKEDLDAIAPNNPVLLYRADGHMAWVNSMAFELAGITAETPNPQGGEFVKNDEGGLLGCITDLAIDPISALIPPDTEEDIQRHMLMAQDHLLSLGITSQMDAGVSIDTINIYKDLYEQGQLKLRSYPLIYIVADTSNEEADYVRDNAPEGRLFDDRLLLQGVKIETDGSLGARSAAMLEEYSDRPGYTGEFRFTPEQLYDAFKLSYDNGYQICTHTIGDGAAREVIDTLERCEQENPRDDVRLRIEHFQVVNVDDITRAIEMGIIPSMQYCHATSDMLMAEDRIGQERMQGAYAWRTVIDQGGIIVAGTDAPVELSNPWHNFYAGVTRTNRAGDPEGGWYPEQAVTREEALKSYTSWCAYGQFEEDILGSLTVGKWADFVVIDRDVMTCPEDEIKDVQAVMTAVAGEVLYRRDVSEAAVLWHGDAIDFNSPLIEDGDAISVPVNDVAATIGAAVEVNDTTATVTLDDLTATLDLSNVDGTDYVSATELFEGLGQSVVWNDVSRTLSTSTLHA
ncbi:MAG: amidohydrolase family protein [Oscillospiraceae bacterium]|nr:amidohydrolase family protein [Oscillospiraceae bacterium]